MNAMTQNTLKYFITIILFTGENQLGLAVTDKRQIIYDDDRK
jgi:hypothetical protein